MNDPSSTAQIKDLYEHAECQDCGLSIPDDAQAEEACTNCGHVFQAMHADFA